LESLKENLDFKEKKHEYRKKQEFIKAGEEEKNKAARLRNAAKLIRIREAYENGIDTLEEYKHHKERLEKERSELETQHINLNGKLVDEEKKENSNTIMLMKSPYELLADPDIDNQIKGNALRSVVKKIVYDKEHNKLKFFYY
jgi:predicted lipoprotein